MIFYAALQLMREFPLVLQLWRAVLWEEEDPFLARNG
jgi:hypothetical protein